MIKLKINQQNLQLLIFVKIFLNEMSHVKNFEKYLFKKYLSQLVHSLEFKFFQKINKLLLVF